METKDYKFLRVTTSTFEKFNKLRESYRAKSANAFLSDLTHYFNVTHANPYELNLEQNFTHLKAWMDKKFEALQKRNTAVERDAFVPMYNKIDFIYHKAINEQQPHFENIQDSAEIDNLREKIERKNETLKKYESMLEEQANEIKKLSRFANQIKNTHVIEKGFTKTTISIKLDPEIFKKMLGEI